MIFSRKLPRFQFFNRFTTLACAYFRLPATNLFSQSKMDAFLEIMKSCFQRQHARLVSSYRMALFYSLKALQLQQGSIVLVTPITIADTINAIRLAGLKPVFVDLDINTHALSLDDLRLKYCSDCKVLVLTYLSGMIPELSEIIEFCKNNGLTLIEDFSQAIDAKYQNRPIGSHGDISLASLSIGKNISTLYGGLILSENQMLIEKIDEITKHKISEPSKNVLHYYLANCLKVQIATSHFLFSYFVYPFLKIISFFTGHYPPRFNHDPHKSPNIFCSSDPKIRSNFPDSFYVPINDWQLSLAIDQIIFLNEGTKKRRLLAKTLVSHLSPESLQLVPGALLNYDECSYYHFPIYCQNKKSALQKALFINGIDNGSYGLNLCSEEPGLEMIDPTVKNATRIKHDTLFLPIHESHTNQDMIKIAKTLNHYVKNLGIT